MSLRSNLPIVFGSIVVLLSIHFLPNSPVAAVSQVGSDDKDPKRLESDVAQLREVFLSIRGKRFIANLRKYNRGELMTGYSVRAVKVEQDCFRDGFRRIVVDRQIEPKAEGVGVFKIVSEYLITCEGEKCRASKTYTNDGRETADNLVHFTPDAMDNVLSTEAGSFSFLGFVFDGQRTWDLSDPLVWEVTRVARGVKDEVVLTMPNNKSISFQLRKSGDGIQITHSIVDQNGNRIDLGMKWVDDQIVETTSNCKYDSRGESFDVKDVMTIVAIDKCDGVREFQLLRCEVGARAFVTNDLNMQYEYVGQGKVEPLIRD